MSILLIDKIKQKNNGTFKLMDAIDINWDGFSMPNDVTIDAYTKKETDAKIEAAKYNDTSVKASISANKTAIDKLNGSGDGSVDKKISDAIDAFATKATDDGTINTLKELIDYVAAHGGEVSTMQGNISANKTAIANLVKLVGSLPVSTEAKTIVEYIDEKVGAIDYSEAIAEAKQAAIDAAKTDATSKANTAETNAKKYADGLAKNYATAAQGGKADTALQKVDITEGLTNGSISVKGEDVSVHGLGTAAYEAADSFEKSGAAANALAEAKKYTDGKVGDVDLSGIATNANAIAGLTTRMTTAEGKLTTIQGTGVGSITKAVSDAKSALEAKIKTNTDAISTINGTGAGSIKKAVSDAQTTLQGNIDANKTVLDRLDGAASVTGSVKKQIADAKADLEKKIADSTYNDTDLTARVAANESSITKLNGADTVTGSVAKQVKDAKDTVESKIGILTNLATASKGNVVGAVNEVKSSIDSLKTSSAISVDTTNTTSGMAKSYQIKQGAKLITTIDIPKDMVVKSGTVEKNPVGQASGTYLVLTLANATNDKVYINVGTLVDIYTAQASATQVQLTIDSTTREISAVIVAGSIGTTELANGAVTTTKIADANVTKAKLDKTVQASLDKADTALQESNVSALRTDVSNIKTSLADGGATAKAIAAAKKAGDDAQTSVKALEQRVTGLEGNTFTAITNEQIEALFAKIN